VYFFRVAFIIFFAFPLLLHQLAKGYVLRGQGQTDYFTQRYYRIFYKIRPPKFVLTLPEVDGANSETEASSKGKSGRQGNGSHDG
jgi:hypothetical protein